MYLIKEGDLMVMYFMYHTFPTEHVDVLWNQATLGISSPNKRLQMFPENLETHN